MQKTHGLLFPIPMKSLEWIHSILFSPIIGYTNSSNILQLLQICPIMTGLINRMSKKNNNSSLTSLFTEDDKMHHEDAKLVNLVLKNLHFCIAILFRLRHLKEFHHKYLRLMWKRMFPVPLPNLSAFVPVVVPLSLHSVYVLLKCKKIF